MNSLGATIWKTSPAPVLGWSKIASILALIVLAGCSNAPLAVPAPAINAARPPEKPALPLPEPVRTLPVEWSVVTPSRLPSGADWVLFALSPTDYERLSANQAEYLRWSMEASHQLRYYRGQ